MGSSSKLCLLAAVLLVAASYTVGEAASVTAQKSDDKSLPISRVVPSGSLRALAITNADNDQDQLATVVAINMTTGKLGFFGNFTYAVTVVGVDCATTYGGASTTYSFAEEQYFSLDSQVETTTLTHQNSNTTSRVGYVAAKTVFYGAEGPTPNIAIIDAMTGTVLSRKPLQTPNYGIASLNFNPATGLLIAVGGDGTSVDYLSINATTGVLTTITKGLPMPNVIVCESALSIATTRFYTLSHTKDTDDSDEILLTLDLTTGKVLSKVPWDASTKKIGFLNAIYVLPANTMPGQPDEAILGWDIDYNFARPAELVMVDPMTGNFTVLCTVPKGYDSLTVPSGAMALLPTQVVTAIGFDNGADQTYFLSHNLVAGSTSSNSAAPPLCTIIEVDQVGTQFIWSPVWVPTPTV